MPDAIHPQARSALASGAIFPDAVERLGERIGAGDWAGAMTLVRPPRQLDVLSEWWAGGEMAVEELRAILPGAWSASTITSEMRWWPLFRDAGYSGSPLPLEDPITAFRGGQPGDPMGMAWSIDREAAVREACRWPRAASSVVDGVMMLGGEIVIAQLPRGKVAAHVERAGVDELIAHPRSVRIIGRESVQLPVR